MKWNYSSNGGSILIAQLDTPTPAVAHTGTVAETDLWSFTIPGGLLLANSSLELDITWQFVGTAGTKTARFYYGTYQFGFPFYAATTIAARSLSGFVQANSASVQRSRYIGNTAATPYGVSTSALVTGAINSTVDQTFKVSMTLANAADSAQIMAAEVIVRKNPTVKLN